MFLPVGGRIKHPGHREFVSQLQTAADPESVALRTRYNVPLRAPQVFYMSVTDYSDL